LAWPRTTDQVRDEIGAALQLDLDLLLGGIGLSS
jgi:hypothetical protein